MATDGTFHHKEKQMHSILHFLIEASSENSADGGPSLWKTWPSPEVVAKCARDLSHVEPEGIDWGGDDSDEKKDTEERNVILTAARRKDKYDEDSDDEVIIKKRKLDQPLSPDSIPKARPQVIEKKSLLEFIDGVDYSRTFCWHLENGILECLVFEGS